MKRIHLKKRKIIKKRNILFFILIMLVIFSIFFIKIISDRITPILISTGEMRINEYSIAIMNNAISQVIEDKISVDELFTNVKDSNGNIVMIDFNPNVVNQILSLATTVVLNDLKLLEVGDLDTIGTMNISNDERINLEKGIVASIPIGAATGITILSNLGPKIPIRLHYIGDVNSNITTKVTAYGINNALIEIGIHLEVTAQIILPFSTKTKVVETDMPIAIKMVQGSVPELYSGYLNSNSSIYSTPVE